MSDQPRNPASPAPVFDPFGALGLPRRFDLSEPEIEGAFLQRLAGTHPDIAGDAASMDAAALTAARSTLSDPEKRAAALLSLLGGPSAADDDSLPDGFLMEIMELRSEVEDELAGGDEAARARWEAFANDRRAAHIAAVRELFAGLVDTSDAGRLAEIRTELNAWRYTERLIEQLDPGYDPGGADFA